MKGDYSVWHYNYL